MPQHSPKSHCSVHSNKLMCYNALARVLCKLVSRLMIWRVDEWLIHYLLLIALRRRDWEEPGKPCHHELLPSYHWSLTTNSNIIFLAFLCCGLRSTFFFLFLLFAEVYFFCLPRNGMFMTEILKTPDFPWLAEYKRVSAFIFSCHVAIYYEFRISSDMFPYMSYIFYLIWWSCQWYTFSSNTFNSLGWD